MSREYHNGYFRFRYPTDWTVDENLTEDGLSVNVQSPDTMFLFVSLFERDRSAQWVADQALAAMRSEYPMLDAAAFSGTIAGYRAVGHDVNFLALDLTNTCWIRAFEGPQQTVLIFAQTDDGDLAAGERTFRMLCESFELCADGTE